MSIEPREEQKILKSIADSLETIAVLLKDIRDDLSGLNVEGLVKLIDIVSEQQEIHRIVQHKVKKNLPEPDQKDELVNDLVKIFITGGFKKCEICHKYTFISNVWKDSVCDVCREKYLDKGIPKEKAKEIEKKENNT
ncbi:MAG: hypothetical protein PHV06_07665 [bacterium]|nr:hypothetical protein [bacterium]